VISSRGQRAFFFIGIMPVILMILLPYAMMLSGALKSPDIEVFRVMPLARFFLNSTIVAVGATILMLLCAVPAAYALGRLRFPGRRAALFAILTTQMFSPIVLIIALFSQFTSYGLLEGARCYVALILVDAACRLAFSIWLLTGYFATVPREIEEAAMIVFALTFIPSDEFRTLTVAIPSFIGQYGADWHLLMAGALLATIPVVALFLSIEKHLVRGLSAGAIK
jgi:multiple sugar transport system permease protein